jgi:hypothetical protein
MRAWTVAEHDWFRWEAERQAIFASNQTWWWLIQAGVLVIWLLSLRRLRDYEAMAYGFVPVYFLTAPTYYYYAMLLVPLFFFAPQLRESRLRLAGVVVLLGTTASYEEMVRAFGRNVETSFATSCLLLALSIYMLVVAYLSRPEQDVVASVER